jgi:hypothetical protein
MKTTKVLLLGAFVTAFTFSSFAVEPLLSPRAAGNQIKHVTSAVDAPTVTITYVDTTPALLSPRAQDNQIRHVAGTNHDIDLANAPRPSMSPKDPGYADALRANAISQQIQVAPLK